MKYVITVFFTMSIFFSQAQNASLKGKVLQHSFKIRKEERKTPPVASVEVKSSWANPKTTQTDGSFHLIFHDLEPGEAVKLSVKKEGYEVVNKEKLNTNIPNDPDKQPLTLYIVKTQLLADARFKYYNIAKTNMQKGLEKKIAQLNKESKNYKVALQRLQEEKKNLLKAARELADKFARETFENTDSLYIKAFETYQSGNINGAIAILTSVDSYKEGQKGNAQLKKGKEIQNIGIEMEAEAMKVIAQNIKNLQFKKANYEELAKKEPDVYLDDLADIQNNLGYLYKTKNQYDKAEEYYLKSLAIREELAKKEPEVYLSDLAHIQNSLGALYKAKNQYDKAEEYYLKCLAIYEELAKKEPDVYINDLADIQNNLGVLYKFKNQYDEVYKYSEGLAAVKLNDKRGYINQTGEVVIPIKYDKVLRYFSEGLAAVNLNDKWGYINKTGEVVIPIKYDYASSFSEGLAIVKLNGKYGYINVTGEVVISIKYDDTWSFSKGLAAVNLNDKYGYINKTGEVVIPIKYDYASSFSEGLARVNLNDKYGYINKTGKVVIPFKYDDAWSFSEGLARVILNGETFYIDKEGKRVK